MDRAVLNLVSHAVPPTAHHVGWVEMRLIDRHGVYTDDQLRTLSSLLHDGLLPPELSGFAKNGGVFDYEVCYLGLDIEIEVPTDIHTAVMT